MNADIVAQMRLEEADLVRKLKAVRDFLAAYGEAPNDGSSAQPRREAAASPPREKVEITSFTEQTRRSVLLSMEAMVHTNGLLKTAQLVDYVEKRGHEISGNNKVNALGALLARSVDVKGFGKSGWDVVDRDRALKLLTEYEYKEKEPTSPTAVGSDAGGGSVPAQPLPSDQPSDQSAYS